MKVLAALVILILAGPADRSQANDVHASSAGQLIRDARRGDQAAELELGSRYEQGRDGLPCDLRQAKHWYKAAARGAGQNRLTYSAPVGGERFGRMVAGANEPPAAAAILAQVRLARLNGKVDQPSGGFHCQHSKHSSSTSTHVELKD